MQTFLIIFNPGSPIAQVEMDYEKIVKERVALDAHRLWETVYVAKTDLTAEKIKNQLYSELKPHRLVIVQLTSDNKLSFVGLSGHEEELFKID